MLTFITNVKSAAKTLTIGFNSVTGDFLNTQQYGETFPFNALGLLVGRQEGYQACKKTGCWFVGDGDDLTGALHVLQLPPPPPSLAPLESRMEGDILVLSLCPSLR